MAAPTFIQEAETAWNSSTTPKTTASFSVLASDILVAWAIKEGYNSNPPDSNATISISGGSLSWTNQQTVQVTDYTWVAIWTATVDVDKSMTVTFTKSNSGNMWWGGNVLTFRGSEGIGASAKTNVASGAPTLNLTTTQADSAIVVANGDWAAVDGATRTWRTNAGAFTENTYFRDASRYAVYGGRHANAGAVGTYAVGLSAPSGQKYSIIAVEVKGSLDVLMAQACL